MNDARSGSLLDFIEDFTNRFPACVDEYETLLTDNRILKQRLVGIGVVDPDRQALGFTGRCCVARAWPGTCARCSPTKSTTCSISSIPVGVNGDCYDHYLVRIAEMRGNNRIIRQCVEWLRNNPGPVMIENHKIAPPKRTAMKGNMEEADHHFKLFTEGFHAPG